MKKYIITLWNIENKKLVHAGKLENTIFPMPSHTEDLLNQNDWLNQIDWLI